jgi:hypothetical protein
VLACTSSVSGRGDAGFADVQRADVPIEDVLSVRRAPLDRRSPWPKFRGNVEQDGRVEVTLHLPNCCFPAYRTDGKPSVLRVLDRRNPLAAGLPDSFALERTEMYDEPFHVPEPDEVVLEERFEDRAIASSEGGTSIAVSRRKASGRRLPHVTWPVSRRTTCESFKDAGNSFTLRRPDRPTGEPDEAAPADRHGGHRLVRGNLWG